MRMPGRGDVSQKARPSMAATTVMKAAKAKATRALPGTQERAVRERMAPAMAPAIAFVPARPAGAQTQERIPRVMRRKVEALLEESYAFMDSPVFKQRNIEKEL